MQREHEKLGRRSVRLPQFDYAQPGYYAVTICTQWREPLFGEVDDGLLLLNEFGEIVEDEWRRLAHGNPLVCTDYYVVMPNHFHGIINILDALPNTSDLRTARPAGLQSAPPGSLGAIVRHFKGRVSRRINELRNSPGAPVWQRSYYDQVIWTERQLENVREYIINNPMLWHRDLENPDRER